MLDQEGYRPNVGIVLIQPRGFNAQTDNVEALAISSSVQGEISTDKVFWARRVGGHDAWT